MTDNRGNAFLRRMKGENIHTSKVSLSDANNDDREWETGGLERGREEIRSSQFDSDVNFPR